VFDQPRCFLQEINGKKLSLAGFPFLRHGIREKFRGIVERTGWKETQADANLLCMHQSVDGATMGPKNFMFRGGADVIDIREVPPDFAAVLTGHMHRHQVLQKDLRGKPVATPVLYSGSIERTSFAEKDETKGYMTIVLEDDRTVHWHFHELQTRPMVSLEIDISNMTTESIVARLVRTIGTIPVDSVIRVRITGESSVDISKVVSTRSIRSIIPDTMTISVTGYYS
jgi:DNA repair exonuclease SbcCD nuclease subunit